MTKKLLALLLAGAMLLSLAACAGQQPPAGEVSEEEAVSELSQPDGEESEGATEIPDGFELEDLPDRTAYPDEVFASYGEYTISVPEFVFFHEYVLSQYSSMMGGMPLDGMLDIDQGGKTLREHIYDEALSQAKWYMVIFNMAVANGRAATEEEREANKQNVDNLLQEMGGDEQAFLNYIHLTPDQFARANECVEVAYMYRAAEMEGITPTEADKLAAYEANREQFNMATVRHVLILADETMSAEEQDAAKVKAEGILAQAEGGADMAALAAEHSEDPGSKDTGGVYTFPVGQMVPEFENWSFDPARKAGDTGIVKTSYGYHVMQFVSLTGYAEADPSQLEAIARSDLFEKAHAEAFAAINSEGWTVNETHKQNIVG